MTMQVPPLVILAACAALTASPVASFAPTPKPSLLLGRRPVSFSSSSSISINSSIINSSSPLPRGLSRRFMANGSTNDGDEDEDDDITDHSLLGKAAPVVKDNKKIEKKEDGAVPYQDIRYEEFFDGNRPENAFELAADNFQRQGRTIVSQLMVATGLKDLDPTKPPGALRLTLSNNEVTATERLREENGGKVDAHPVSQALYDVGCLFLDKLFDGRPIQRFWFLEVIARIPYFSYISMLHFYESLGWWRAVELRKVHNAQEWNELHHLLIMESLGGNSVWSDRFLGYHVAIAYYWFLILVFLGSPRIAYQFMELLEAHAVDTYGTFISTNRQRLSELPAPKVAISYYKTGDLYLFDDFQVSTVPGTRRPPCDNLLQVFENICQDESEHVKTMRACQDYAVLGARVVSPHVNYPKQDPPARSLWQEWSDSINEDPSEMDGF